MGASRSSIVYSLEVPGQLQPLTSTKIRRHPQNLAGLQQSPSSDIITAKHMFEASFNKHSKKNCFGTIAERSSRGNSQKTIDYVSYETVYQRICSIGNSIVQLKLFAVTEEVLGSAMSLAGIYANNCVEWLLVDLACCLFGITTVPISDTLTPQNLAGVLMHSGVTVVFCSELCCQVLLDSAKLGKITTVISFGEATPELVRSFKSKNITLLALDDMMQKEHFKPNEQQLKPQQCWTLSFTSDTAEQQLKAAMLSHRNLCSGITSIQSNNQLQLCATDVYLSSLPLPHIMERLAVYTAVSAGATVCFSSGNPQQLPHEIELVRPTVFCNFPRMYSRLYHNLKDKLRDAKGCEQSLLRSAFDTKLENLANSGRYEHWFYDRVVFRKTKEYFGGRVRYMLSGGAPLLPHVHSFMKVAAVCPVFQGYGLTESTGASFMTDANDPTTGHVGGPTSNVEFKLQDIPEMGYTHDYRDEKGIPEPRGEVCIRGPGVFLGYYKDPERTRKVLDQDGWFHTGDVGAILLQSGALKIIDRKKNIFKLQQGQYVVSKKVEGVLLKRPEVYEVFLYGDSSQSFAVAIIVPHKQVIEQMGKDLGIVGKFEYLCTNPRIRRQLLTQLNDFAKSEGLKNYELPKNVYLEPVSFRTQGILTDTTKLLRYAAKKLYAGQINAMYREGMFVDKEL